MTFFVLVSCRASSSFVFTAASRGIIASERRARSRYVSMPLSSTQLAMSNKQHKIFCYGDSLTAGTTTSPELSPYGPHLELSLKELMSDSGSSAMVRWSGYPGWTASAMADPTTLDGPSGLRTVLRNINARTGSAASLCIILAGTNDLAYAVDALPIVNDIQVLHRASHDEGVPTVAVGIPPSAWQRSNADAANLAATVNTLLREWCDATPMATFVPCPIHMSTVGNELWSSDGLHLSKVGYQALGKGLAPSIANVVANLEAKM